MDCLIMLTSFEVIEAANISRATLNNYISQGLLPRPLVKNPEPGTPTSARQIGYFPEEVLIRLERISELKKEGYAMAEIASQLEAEGFEVPLKMAMPQDTGKSYESIAVPTEEDITPGSNNVPRTVMPSKSNLLRETQIYSFTLPTNLRC